MTMHAAILILFLMGKRFLTECVENFESSALKYIVCYASIVIV